MTCVLPLLLVGGLSAGAGPQAAPPPPPAPAQTAPARKPAAQRSRGPATATLTIAVTDGGGLPVQGVEVKGSGPVEREGSSLVSGIVRFLGLRSGTYRLRFSHPKYVLLERDVVMRAGAPQSIDVMLSAAPQAPEPDEPAEPEPAPEPAVTAPAGEPRAVPVVDFVEDNFIRGRDPVKEDALGCTASARTTLIQLREPQPERALADTDEVIYVVAGEGTLRLGNRDVALRATTLAVVPRGTVRGITRKGRNPLIFVSVQSGPPCTR